MKVLLTWMNFVSLAKAWHSVFFFFLINTQMHFHRVKQIRFLITGEETEI